MAIIENPTEQTLLEGMIRTMEFEGGHREKVYLDTEGSPTIGFGHVLDSLKFDTLPEGYKEMHWNKEKGQETFLDDYLEKEKRTARKFGKEKFESLPKDAQTILVDLAFNMGGDKIFQSFGEARNVRPMRKMDVINTIIGPLSADILEIMTSGVSIAMGAASQDKELRAREYSDLVTLGTNLMPFKSIWWSKMLWRKYITEYFTELIDPKGYKRAQKRIKKRTYEQKGTGIFFGKPVRKPDGLLMELLK